MSNDVQLQKKSRNSTKELNQKVQIETKTGGQASELRAKAYHSYLTGNTSLNEISMWTKNK